MKKMNDNIKVNTKDAIYKKTKSILELIYGTEFMYIHKISHKNNIINITIRAKNNKVSEFNLLNMIDSKIEYIVSSYAPNNNLEQIIIIKAKDAIDYINKYDTCEDYISIDLDKFSKLGYIITYIDPNNLKDVDIYPKYEVVDFNNLEYFDAKLANTYVTGLTYVNDEPMKVKINPNTHNIIAF